jgi:PAS domain S-box-containing protein
MPRFRLKTKLVLGISGMVFTLVVGLSWVYVTQLVRQRIAQSYEGADFVSHQILHGVRQALEIDLTSSKVDTSDPQKLHDTIEEILQTDPGLNSLLQSIIGYSPTIYDAAIVDTSGMAMVHTDAAALGRPMTERRDFNTLRSGSTWHQIKTVYGNPGVYELRLPLQQNGAPFGDIRVGVSTVFLRSELRPQLNRALIFSAIAILASLALAAGLSNYALRPLEMVGRRLDQMTAGAEPPPDLPKDTDEFGQVTIKIDRLGRQVRDVKEVFSALKENLDQIMGTLQDGLVLFTRDSRIVLVSASAERFVGRSRGDMLGSRVEDVFDDSTRLGRIILDAFALQQPFPQREVEIEHGRRMQVALDFIQERGQPIGALLTMRDAESVRRLENEIELSRRLAAIGRLTSGVAHEVKNPINAIVLHVEVLKEKLAQMDAPTQRHLEVISSEIRRLDRVVQTLVDFTRPVELRLVDVDLRRIVEDVIVLSAPDAERQRVHLRHDITKEPLNALVDADLIKQGLLNVILNGVQSMPNGGDLWIRAFRDNLAGVIEIQDQGMGIPAAIRDKIFNLYFTTKKAGSGIGLAMTYRVMQLHNGALEFESVEGKGTTFHFELPLGGALAGTDREIAGDNSSGATQQSQARQS